MKKPTIILTLTLLMAFTQINCVYEFDKGRTGYSHAFRHDPHLDLKIESSLIKCPDKPELVLYCPIDSHPIMSPSAHTQSNYTYLRPNEAEKEEQYALARALGCRPSMCEGYVFVEKTCYENHHGHGSSLGGTWIAGHYPSRKSQTPDHIYEESCRRIFQKDLRRLNLERKDLYYYTTTQSR